MKKKPHIFLIFHGRFPSEKAHALFVAKSYEAFRAFEYEVTLVVPNRRHSGASPKDYYGLKCPVDVVYLPTLDLIHLPFLKYVFFYLSNILFSLGVLFYLRRHATSGDIVYTNESLILLLLRGRNVCYELHDFPEERLWWYRRLYRHARHILITNKLKYEQFCKLFPEQSYKAFVELNAVDVDMFDLDISKEEACRKLNIPSDKRVIVYTGHLYGWKGVETLVDAVPFLKDSFVVYFVGGTEEAVEEFRAKYKENKAMIFVGHRPYAELPLWQKAADILVIPNTAKEKISKYYTSPMKLFTYLTAKRPIVASNVPSIREIAGDQSVYYAEPDDPKSLASVIKDVATHEPDMKRIIHGFQITEAHTWSKRANRILQRIDKLI